MVTRRVLGYSITFNLQPGQRTTRGVIVWDGAGTKVMVTVFGNANILNVVYPSFGNAAYLANSQTQVWAATEGNASWTVFPGGSRAMHGHNAKLCWLVRLRGWAGAIYRVRIRAGAIQWQYRVGLEDGGVEQRTDSRAIPRHWVRDTGRALLEESEARPGTGNREPRLRGVSVPGSPFPVPFLFPIPDSRFPHPTERPLPRRV
jgi:hypothetical protein